MSWQQSVNPIFLDNFSRLNPQWDPDWSNCIILLCYVQMFVNLAEVKMIELLSWNTLINNFPNKPLSISNFSPTNLKQHWMCLYYGQCQSQVNYP